ncbi:MAG: hypothetical protein ABEJ28_00235 [Salinigranum sp.]
MQRRAAAIYVVFFLIVGAASYSLIATAHQPTISFNNAKELKKNDTFQIGERTYTVSDINAQVEGGGAESEARLVRSGKLTWTNQQATYTDTWDNNSTVTVNDNDWRVLIPNETDPGSFTLQEVQNRTKILQNDDNADNQLVTHGGTKYVVVTQNGSRQLVPADQYFPAPKTQSYDEGGSIDYNGNQTTFSNVSASAVTIQWVAPKKNTVSLPDQSNVTLDNQTYLSYFPDNSTLVLTQQFQSYNEQTTQIANYKDHIDGLWGVTELSFVTAFLLIAIAYLPSRY